VHGLDRIPPATRTELLGALVKPDVERAATIGEYWADPATRPFAELLIECETNTPARALLVGMLRERARTR
jgi:hypothetical protein